MIHLILNLCLAAGPLTAEVESLSGEIVSGAIVELSNRQIVVATDNPEKSRTIAVADLQQIRLRPVAQPHPSPAAWVELTDGSQLLAAELALKQGRCQITLPWGGQVSLPGRALRTIRFQKQTTALAAEWSRLLASKPSADMAVLRKKDKLDVLEGVLQEIDDKAAVFTMDDEPVRIGRGKLEGLILFPPRERPAAAAAVIVAQDGSRYQAGQFSVTQGKMELTTPSGLKLTQPLERIAQVDFAAGKTVWLDDLEPQLAQWTPYFPTTKLSEPLGKLFHLRRNQAILAGETAGDDGAMQLRYPGENGLANIRSFRKGLALHSRSRVVYELQEPFRHFQAIAGIDARVGRQGHVQLKIEGDGRELLSVSISGQDAPRPIDVDIRGVKELVLTVDYGQHLDVGDYLNLCEARLLR